MKKKVCETFVASITIGLNRGYSNEVISNEEFTESIQKIQHQMKNEYNVLLSAKVTPCNIIFLGQNEPSVTLEFINYPKFPLSNGEWKKSILIFTEKIMNDLEQNRVVVVFVDETIMLEQNSKIDPRVFEG